MDDERRPSSQPPAVVRAGSRVIKGDSGDSSGEVRAPMATRRGVLNAEEFEAHTTAKQIVLDAQKKADEIKAEALRFKEEVFAKAREEAKADVQARSVEELARAKMQAGQLLAESEKTMIDLALKIAEKIIGRDLERDPEAVVDIAANVIQASRANKALTLRVHPEDGKILRAKRPKLMEILGRTADIAIRDDSEIERGGCMIQTEFGVVDGLIRTQVDMLRNVLLPDSKKENN